MNDVKHCNQTWKHEPHTWHSSTEDGIQGHNCTGEPRR